MKSHTIIGIIIILFGLSILFHFPVFNLIFALFVLWIGVKVLTGQGGFGNFMSETKGTLNEDYLSRVLIFSGIKTTVKSENFEGAELVSVFGGGEVDASGVKTKKQEINIEITSIFGGFKLIIPKGWEVKSEGVGIIGGYNNNTKPFSKPTITVHVKGAAIFGGVEIVN